MLTVTMLVAVMMIGEPQIVPRTMLGMLGFDQIICNSSFETCGREEVSAKRRSDGARLDFYVEESSTLKEEFQWNTDRERYEQTPLSAFETDTPSGMPIGSDFRTIGRGNFFRAKALGRYERVDVSIHTAPDVDANGYMIQNDNEAPQSAKSLVELMIRQCVSRLVAHRLVTQSNVTINGAPCPGYLDTRSNHRFLDLRIWGLAYNWQHRFNEDTATAILTRGNRTLIVPLGSRKIKVGSNWVETGDVIAFKNERMFVRHSFLQSQ